MLTTPLLAEMGDNDLGALFFAIPIVAIVCSFLYKTINLVVNGRTTRDIPGVPGSGPYRRWRGGPSQPPAGGLTAEEQAVLLKLQQTLAQMERRIESLETILIDQARTQEKYGTKH